MQACAETLAEIADQFKADDAIPEADWSKIRSLEFQDALRARAGLQKQLKKRTCVTHPDFEINVSLLSF